VRADDWLRWARDQTEEFHNRVQPEIDDQVSIPFYLLAKGKLVNVGSFLSGWYGWYGYQLSVRMLEFARVSYSIGKLPQLPELLSELGRCRKPPPALIAAALSVFPEMDADLSRKVLPRLAMAPAKPEDAGDDFQSSREADSYRLGLLRCAIRAAHLGLGDDARKILSKAMPRRYSLYALTDAWSAHYIVPWVLAIATRTAAEAREPNLFECLPSELWTLVETEACPATQQEQITLLLRKVTETGAEKEKVDANGKKVPPVLSSAERHHAPDRIRGQIVALVQLIQELKAIILARTPDEMAEKVKHFFDSWVAHQEAAKKDAYAYRDKGRFLNEIYSSCALNALTALGEVNATSGGRFRACLDGNFHLR
jgi:hypothetical protein